MQGRVPRERRVVAGVVDIFPKRTTPTIVPASPFCSTTAISTSRAQAGSA